MEVDAFEYASAELKGDKAVVLSAVSVDGCELQYASADLYFVDLKYRYNEKR